MNEKLFDVLVEIITRIIYFIVLLLEFFGLVIEI